MFSRCFIAFSTAILINGIYSLKLGAILVGSAVLFAVGLVDDFKEVPAGFKLMAQILCTLLVMSCGIVLQVVPVGLGIFSLVGNITKRSSAAPVKRYILLYVKK